MNKLTMLLTILFLVSACGSSQSNSYKVIYSMETDPLAVKEQGQNGYTIAVVPKVSGIPYFNVARDGAMEAATDLNVNVIYEGPAVAEVEAQIDVIRKFIAARVDVIAVSANDPEKLLPVLKEADEAGIKVLTWDADTEPEGREFFVNMVDPEVLGRHLLDMLAWSMGEEGEYAIMTGALSASNQNEWIKWMKQQQSEYYPHMRLVEIAATDDDAAKAYDEARRLLEEHPNLKGIVGNASLAPPAAAQAVKESGKAGAVKVVGLSTPSLMHHHLLDGSAQMATLWSPKKLGYLTVALARNLAAEELPYDGQEINNVGIIRVTDDIVIMGEPLDFTAENVGQYDF